MELVQIISSSSPIGLSDEVYQAMIFKAIGGTTKVLTIRHLKLAEKQEVT